MDQEKGPSAEQIVQLEARLAIVNNLPNWFIKQDVVSVSDGYKLKLWTVVKEVQETKYYQTINNTPLQLAIAWMVHRDLVSDMNSYIVQHVTNQVFIDLDW